MILGHSFWVPIAVHGYQKPGFNNAKDEMMVWKYDDDDFPSETVARPDSKIFWNCNLWLTMNIWTWCFCYCFGSYCGVLVVAPVINLLNAKVTII